MSDNHSYREELVHPSAYVAPGAVILGDVTIGEQCSVWYGAVVRGDLAPITVRRGSNIQDGCIIHVEGSHPCRIGEGVTIGHGALLHGCTIEDNALVGIGATVLDGAVVGRGSIVGAGAVVTENVIIPPDSVVLGVPGKVVDSVTCEQRQRSLHAAQHYVDATRALLERHKAE